MVFRLAGVYAELTAVPLEFVVPLPWNAALDIAAAVAVADTTGYVLTRQAHPVTVGQVVAVIRCPASELPDLVRAIGITVRVDLPSVLTP